jgi:hypothetical protein
VTHAAAGDAGGALDKWFRAAAAHVALVRPDLLVFGTYTAQQMQAAAAQSRHGDEAPPGGGPLTPWHIAHAQAVPLPRDRAGCLRRAGGCVDKRAWLLTLFTAQFLAVVLAILWAGGFEQQSSSPPS